MPMQDLGEILGRAGDRINERIVSGLADQTPNMQMQHMGLYWFIHFRAMANRDEQITTSTLMRDLKLNRMAIHTMTANLVELGLLQKTQVLATHGRGRMWAFTPTKTTEEAAEQLSRSRH
jgi:hypothetical protein